MTPEILRRALMRLTQLQAATDVEDLLLPPSNLLETLRGDSDGQRSLSINQNWRVCFRFEDSKAYDVDILDYH